MTIGKFKSPIYLFYALVFYVFAQFIWWWYLIFQLNQKIYSVQEFSQKKIWMILGEGLVFFILLILGIIAVRKAFKKQENLAKKEENFLLSVSHELKSPLASVQLFLQTLEKHKNLTEDQKSDIYKKSIKEVNRLDELVSNILFTANIENDNSNIEVVETNVKLLIENRIEILKNTLLVDRMINTELYHITANIDPQTFDSVVTNLIENAVKYSEKNSKIEVKLMDLGTSFKLLVVDEGSGIKDENKAHLFKKFYREQSELTRNTKGTGLGLYIVKYIVGQHKGEININNNQNKGVTVDIKIPKK